MTTELLLLLVVATISGTAFIARTVTKRRIDFYYERKLADVNAAHARVLEEYKKSQDREMGILLAEFELAKKSIDVQDSGIKAALERAVEVRAEFYPQLVTSLRLMKVRLQQLAMATDEKHGNKPISLGEPSTQRDLLTQALRQLAELEEQFDELLSKVRLFTKKSDYDLPWAVKHLVKETFEGRRGDHFSISEKELVHILERYADDVAYLAGEFYGGPYFDPPIQGSAAYQLSYERLFGGALQRSAPLQTYVDRIAEQGAAADAGKRRG